MPRLLIFLSLLSFLSCQSILAQNLDRYTKVADRLIALINAADYSAIQAMFSKEMSAALPLDKSTAFFKDLSHQLGKIQKLGPARGAPPAVIFPAHFERGLLDLQLSLDPQEKIAGLFFKPHVPSKPAPEKHKTVLSLPFKD